MKYFNLNTFFVHHRSKHHAQNSGYARLMDYYNQAYCIDGKPAISYKIAKILANMSNEKYGIYNSDSVLKEYELYKNLRAYSQSKNVVHYLNAERDIRYIMTINKQFKQTVFCGTFHKPPAILNKQIKDIKFIKQLQGAVTVGFNQVDYIKERFNIDQVAYIPHGVDTQFFRPNKSLWKPNRLLFVGQHLRDFDAFNYCITRLAELIKDLSVHVVVHPAYVKKISFHDSITILKNLSDTELRREYQEASLLFLPMLDSTACNSILESLACGLPIVTTNVGGNAKYLENTQSLLVPPKKYDALIDGAFNLLNNESIIKELSELSRTKSMTYDWGKIYKQIRGFHNSLFIK